MNQTQKSSKQNDRTPHKAIQANKLKRANEKIQKLSKENDELQNQINTLNDNNKNLAKERNVLKKKIKQLQKELTSANNMCKNDRWELVKLRCKLVDFETIKSCSKILLELIRKELFSVTDRLKRKLSV